MLFKAYTVTYTLLYECRTEGLEVISLVMEFSHLLLKGNLRNLSKSTYVYPAPDACIHREFGLLQLTKHASRAGK